jgi:hypothetical protein
MIDIRLYMCRQKNRNSSLSLLKVTLFSTLKPLLWDLRYWTNTCHDHCVGTINVDNVDVELLFFSHDTNLTKIHEATFYFEECACCLRREDKRKTERVRSGVALLAPSPASTLPPLILHQLHLIYAMHSMSTLVYNISTKSTLSTKTGFWVRNFVSLDLSNFRLFC